MQTKLSIALLIISVVLPYTIHCDLGETTKANYRDQANRATTADAVDTIISKVKADRTFKAASTRDKAFIKELEAIKASKGGQPSGNGGGKPLEIKPVMKPITGPEIADAVGNAEQALRQVYATAKTEGYDVNALKRRFDAVSAQ